MPDPTSDLMERMFDRIKGTAPYGVWTPVDFLDLATRSAVDNALYKLVKSGRVRRPHRGLYDKPATDRLTGGLIFPERTAYIDAIARRDRLRIVIDGETAAYDLGLIDTPPARSVLLTDSYPRTFEILASAGDVTQRVVYTIEFKSVSDTRLFWAGHPAMRFVQAMVWLKDSGEVSRDAVAATFSDLLRNIQGGEEVAEDLFENLDAVPPPVFPIALAVITSFRDMDPALPQVSSGAV